MKDRIKHGVLLMHKKVEAFESPLSSQRSCCHQNTSSIARFS